MGGDPLGSFTGLERCPSCAALHQEGLPRCPECGTCHVSAAFVDVAPPSSAKQRRQAQGTTPVPDPSHYSLDHDADIVDESFDDVEDMTAHWGGSGSDFTFEDDDAPPQRLPTGAPSLAPRRGWGRARG